MSTESDLWRRLGELERRLDQYHEHLEQSLEHDRQFQMKATWGIVNSAVGIGAWIGVNYAAQHWLGIHGWIAGFLGGLFGFAAFIAAMVWSDAGREKDLTKLSRLPKWEKSWRGD